MRSHIHVLLASATLLLSCLVKLCVHAQEVHELLKPGKCKNHWRHARLLGRCFGLTSHKEFVPELKDLEITTSEDCRALCCNLGEKCISWQYFSNPQDPSVHECKLTDKIIRLGTEATGTPDWCDPHPPSKWNGHRVVSRNGDGTCKWGDGLPSQCFGLGDERKVNGSSLSTESCADACCKDPACGIWQEVPGRGCYYNKDEGIWCDKDPGVYDGARKCVKGFCDGREAELLPK
jgi:hypothetical protein